MTYTLQLEAAAINSAARFLADDPAGLRTVMDTLDQLTDDPRPAGSTELGSTDFRRLRIGRYRALYRIEAQTITVISLGRSPG